MNDSTVRPISRRSRLAILLPALAIMWLLAACQPITGAQVAEDAAVSAPAEPVATEPAPAPHEDGLYAHVVVQFDDYALAIRRIAFDAPLSGLEALEQSGLEITVAETGFGPAVCAVAGVGCPAEDCFCGGDLFWAYSYWDGVAWESYPVGASSSVIDAAGAVEGWRWGEWGASAAPAPQALAAQAGLVWLHAHQMSEDGSYGGAVSAGLDVLIALGANGLHGAAWRAGDGLPSLVDFTVAHGASYAEGGASQAGKLAVALAAAQGGYPSAAPVPTDFTADDAAVMAVEAGPLALAVLGALSLDPSLVDDDALDAGVVYLRELAHPAGGWEWFPGWGPDTNTTALAIQALIAAGVEPEAPEIQAAVAALQSNQNPDGGFPYDIRHDDVAGDPGPSDANSTAYTIQGLIAAGQHPAHDEWRPLGDSPLDFLLALQGEDGAFAWQSGHAANQLATQQAIPALLGRTLPIHAGRLARCE